MIQLPSLRVSKGAAPALLAATAPVKRKILWYSKRDVLPPVSPIHDQPATQREKKLSSPPVKLRTAAPAVQAIVSRPPKPDNQRQTILQPEAPRLQIATEIKIPNMIYQRPAVAPPPLPFASEAPRQLASLSVPRLPMPKVTVLSPPPPAAPKLAETKLSVSAISAPALTVKEVPKLPIPEAPRLPAAKPKPAMPEPPAPQAVVVAAGLASLPSLVAVSVAPAPPPEKEEITVPEGNRAGDFSLSSESKGERQDRSAAGKAPGEAASAPQPALPRLDGENLAEIRVPDLSISKRDLPDLPGPPVARAPEPRPLLPPAPAAPGNLKELLAKAARPSLLPEMSRQRSVESEFFGGKHFYTLSINMPNLTSGSGSWVLRFAEPDGNGNGDAGTSLISSPLAVRKVDPQYAAQAVREKVEGTVILAAQIRRDGTVGGIHVLRGVDPRLDASAALALSQWQFQPAVKNGIPIDLEVLVQIPFRLPSF